MVTRYNYYTYLFDLVERKDGFHEGINQIRSKWAIQYNFKSLLAKKRYHNKINRLMNSTKKPCFTKEFITYYCQCIANRNHFSLFNAEIKKAIELIFWQEVKEKNITRYDVYKYDIYKLRKSLNLSERWMTPLRIYIEENNWADMALKKKYILQNIKGYLFSDNNILSLKLYDDCTQADITSDWENQIKRTQNKFRSTATKGRVEKKLDPRLIQRDLFAYDVYIAMGKSQAKTCHYLYTLSKKIQKKMSFTSQKRPNEEKDGFWWTPAILKQNIIKPMKEKINNIPI